MFVPAGSPIFFLREHRFAVRCRVVTLRQLLWTLFTLLFMLSTCLLHIFLYIFINIGCATLYHLSMMYVTVYNMSFNSNCRILAAELNYRFTILFIILFIILFYLFIIYFKQRERLQVSVSCSQVVAESGCVNTDCHYRLYFDGR